MQVRKLHITDAQAIAENLEKKGAIYLRKCLESARRNAIRKGLNDAQLYVKECYVGKGIRSKMIDIKARGKMGLIRRPKCHLNIIVEERPYTDLFKQVATGNAPKSVGDIVRRTLYQ